VFNYSVSDGHGGTSSSTLTITVLSPNQSYQAGSNTTLNGGNGKSVLDGTAGNDILLGGNGPDVLVGGPNDKLTGGNGPDIFVFGQHFGLNTITDFDVNNDATQVSKALFASVTDLLNHTADSASGAIITASAGDQITLVGVTKAELLAHHAGARFIGAVVFAIAIVALDVAGWRDRDMHARVVVMRFLAVAGMVLDLFPDLGRQIALACRRSATRLATAATGPATLVFRDRLHHGADVHDISGRSSFLLW